MKLVTRRLRNLTICLIVVVGLGWLLRSQYQGLERHAFTSGYILLGVVFFLAAYNWRKKLPALPLGSSAFWAQCHIYVGLLSLGLFWMHVGLRLPNGVLEISLTGLFWTVAGSGLYGLYITRRIPKQLANLREEVIYERIPSQRRQVGEQSRALALDEGGLASVTIAQFYVERLHAFFDRPRSWRYRVWPTSQQRRDLIDAIRDLQRYCSQEEQQTAWRLADLVRKKDDLDYHEAQQWKLKVWLFAHVGLTYSLLVIATVHGIMAHAFAGGVP